MGKTFDKMGMRGSTTGRIFFKDCKVPAKNLLGGEESIGYRQLFKGMDVDRLESEFALLLKDSLAFAKPLEGMEESL